MIEKIGLRVPALKYKSLYGVSGIHRKQRNRTDYCIIKHHVAVVIFYYLTIISNYKVKIHKVKTMKADEGGRGKRVIYILTCFISVLLDSNVNSETSLFSHPLSTIHSSPSLPQRPTGRRLTSIGHSDSSGLSSPSEERRHSGRRGWWGEGEGRGGGGGGNASGGGVGGGHAPQRETSSEFRVGEAVRGVSPRGAIKGSTSMPHFSGRRRCSVYYDGGDESDCRRV